MHVDLGPARQWGERFPVRATAFAEETPPAREVLADSRTMKGGGAAGVATLGAAGVEVAQSVLAETQTAILPLVPYLDTLALGVHRRGARLASRSRSTPGSTTGSGGGDDRRASRRDRRQPDGRGRRCATVPSPSPSSCSCCRSGGPASASGGSLNVSKPRRRPMKSNAGCWRRRLAVLVIATSLLTGCATVGF